ncbi:MAG: bi-domain-containing oxidoreductase [Nitrospirae bacterium]|nr:bi-domain-containing oxidoreductase [Nitrospirota bacterium]
MKQILQNLKSGETELVEVPCPQVKPWHLLIRTTNSLVSAGTERMLVEFGKANLIEKARQQPDKVRMVLEKVKTDGLLPTLDAVRNKLDQLLPMGYCNAGVVIEVGEGVSGFNVGDRVASNGKHAEVVSVPVNLCAKIPESVSDEEGAFTVIGAIALQGIRLAQPTLGEFFVVTGLGLIGLITVQILKAQGCHVLGIDFDSEKLKLAGHFGAETVNLSAGEDPIAGAMAFSRGRGVDGVLITASTKSNEPMHQAALMCRKKGRIVLVGVVGLELSRGDFFEKELTFQVSCSYGPGRYDPAYEEKGQDYPVGYVRWTEQRNFEAVLDLLASKKLDVNPLISHRFPLDKAGEAYQLVGGSDPSLGILLQYPSEKEKTERDLRLQTVSLSSSSPLTPHASPLTSSKVVVGFIGSGNYASAVLIPAFKKTGVHLKSVASRGGVSGVHAGKKFGFDETTTDEETLFENKDINTVVISTQHNSHVPLVCRALKAGKHVFVEKPLAIDRNGLTEIESVYSSRLTPRASPILMVGFNRRFSPQVQKIKNLLTSIKEPKFVTMTVNAGMIPANHWTQDPIAGGGRIIGEGCHFIDLLRFLVGFPIVSVQAVKLGESGVSLEDKVSFTLGFQDGSVGTVHYMANGHKSFPKERLEIFCAGRVLQLNNFRQLQGFGWPGFKKMNLWRQDKGNGACAAAFVNAVREGKSSPIPFDELVEVTRVSFDIIDAMRT